MFSKVAILTLFVATVCGSGSHGDYTSFSYGVADPYTGDVKNQKETRVGDSVVGQYSLIDSDGHRRTVDYAANAHSGFNAVVRRDPAVLAHAVPAVVAAPAVVAPVAHAAPLAYGAYTSPLAYAARAAPLAVSHVTPGAVSYSAYSNSVAQSSPLAYGAYAVPLTHGAVVAPLAYGAIANGVHGLGYAH